MKNRMNTHGISPIIGTVLLLIIAVGAMSVVYLNVLSEDGPANQKYITVIGTVEGTDMVIQHQGGENVPINDIKLQVMFKNETLYIDMEENLSAEAKADGYWGLGERIIIPFPLEDITYQDYDNIKADLLAMDEQENSIAFIGSLDLDVVSDVQVSISVNNSSPQLYENVLFTISVSNPEGVVDAKNVSVRFVIPDSFSFQTIRSIDKGSYNYNTGIWDIGDLVLDKDPVNLEIIAEFVGGDELFEFTQLCLLVDGSGSVRPPDWQIMTKGLSEALRDPDVFPHDGSVELSVIQFARKSAFLEIGPTNITSSTYENFAQDLESLSQRRGGTPLGSGLKRAADTFKDSINFDEDHRQIVNIVTDGMPNRDCPTTPGDYQGNDVSYDEGKASAVVQRNYLLSECSFTEEKDEIDSLAVGTLSGYYTSGPDSAWLNSSIIWPIPGCIAPPFDAGKSWVREVATWEHFYNATKEMFRIIFQGIWINCEIDESYPTDPNETNDRTQVLIVPDSI